MSGHNKWSQIRRQKEKSDSQRSKIFGKFAKLIAAEARKANGNRNSPGLKTAIERAKAENMPNDNILRAINKATDSSTALESVTYEAYGPGGVALIIETLTDNKNKASQEVKAVLARHGFSLAGIGSALWAFEKLAGGFRATNTVPLKETDLAALEKLVHDLEECDEVQEVFTNAE